MATIYNRTRGTRIASDALFATTARGRTRGLLGRDSMRPGEALVFPRCRQIHTLGMRFPIDVAFLSAGGEVLRVVSDLKPGRITAWVPRARTTIELPEGTLEASGTMAGDAIVID